MVWMNIRRYYNALIDFVVCQLGSEVCVTSTAAECGERANTVASVGPLVWIGCKSTTQLPQS